MSTKSEATSLPHIERWTLVLAVLVVAGAALLCGPRGQLGASVGAGLMVLNLAVLRRLRARLARVFSAGRSRSSLWSLIIFFNLKLLGLIVLVYLCIRYLPIDPVPFMVGISILPLGILLGTLHNGLMRTDPAMDKDASPQ